MKCLLPVMVIVLCSGCVAKNVSIEIGNAEHLDATCTGSTSLFIAGGFLCWNQTNGYLAQFIVTSNFEQPSIKAGNDTLTNASMNDFFTDEIDFTYTSIPAATFAPEADLGYHFVIAAGASGTGSFFGEDLIRPKAASTINALFTTNSSIRVIANVQLMGHLLSGEHLTSNIATFPIDLVNSCGVATCPPPATTPPKYSCGNTGQDSPVCQ